VGASVLVAGIIIYGCALKGELLTALERPHTMELGTRVELEKFKN
jgi:hypothetical protein